MPHFRLLIAVLLMAAISLAQNGSANPPAAKPHTASATKNSAPSLPPRAEVEAFLHHLFGYDPDTHYTIGGITWSAAPGLAEIAMDLHSPRGGAQKLFITSDQKSAIAGAMFDFPGVPGALPTETQINQFVRQMTQFNPAVTWVVASNQANALSHMTDVTIVLTTTQGRGVQHFWVTQDGGHALVGELLPFAADPFAAMRRELEKGINGPSRGPANAPVTIVEFGDLQCPACKAADPTVQRLVQDEPKARFVFQQFPLVTIHDWALKAAQFGDCVGQQNSGAVWKFMQEVYASQEQINKDNAGDKLTALATQAGVNGAKVAACSNEPATKAHVEKSMDLGKQVNVQGTPTLFIGGRRINNVSAIPYDSLKKIVEFMATPAGR